MSYHELGHGFCDWEALAIQEVNSLGFTSPTRDDLIAYLNFRDSIARPSDTQLHQLLPQLSEDFRGQLQRQITNQTLSAQDLEHVAELYLDCPIKALSYGVHSLFYLGSLQKMHGPNPSVLLAGCLTQASAREAHHIVSRTQPNAQLHIADIYPRPVIVDYASNSGVEITQVDLLAKPDVIREFGSTRFSAIHTNYLLGTIAEGHVRNGNMASAVQDINAFLAVAGYLLQPHGTLNLVEPRGLMPIIGMWALSNNYQFFGRDIECPETRRDMYRFLSSFDPTDLTFQKDRHAKGISLQKRS